MCAGQAMTSPGWPGHRFRRHIHSLSAAGATAMISAAPNRPLPREQPDDAALHYQAGTDWPPPERRPSMFTRRILTLAATLLTALTIAGSTAAATAGPSHTAAMRGWCIPPTQSCP
jgi:hypothetical protein